MAYQESGVFEETYQKYLNEIARVDFKAVAGRLGAGLEDDSLIIPYFNRIYRVSRQGVAGPSGRMASFPVCVVLLKYILMCPETEPGGGSEWMTFRDFRDAGPLTVYFTANTNKTIEEAFTGRVSDLADALLRLGGEPGEMAESYDLSMKIKVLPKIPVMINFNDQDDEFKASSTILYPRSTEAYLDMECVAITGTYLAGSLINSV